MPAGSSEQENPLQIELLTIQEVAEWAKVSTKTVHRWIETGKLPVVKFGNRIYRIPADAVTEHLRNSGYAHLIETRKGKQ